MSGVNTGFFGRKLGLQGAAIVKRAATIDHYWGQHATSINCSAMFPHFFSGTQGGLQGIERTQEDIRLALDAYHRELQKLNATPGQNPSLTGLPGLPGLPGLLALQQQALQQHHLATNGGGVQDLSLGKVDPRNKMINGVSEEEKEKIEEAMRHAGSAFSLVRPKQEPTTAPQSTPGGSSASSPLGNSILPPAMTPSEEFSGAAAASPLQRMASITNSLISQPSTPTHHAANQRPLKAVLPPITQQQFDLYNNLNTEDIVKRVSWIVTLFRSSWRWSSKYAVRRLQIGIRDNSIIRLRHTIMCIRKEISSLLYCRICYILLSGIPLCLASELLHNLNISINLWCYVSFSVKETLLNHQ